MNKSLELLLQLEGLGLVQKSLRLAGPQANASGLSQVEAQVNKLRRQVPGRVLSLFDQLARRYADPVAAVANGCCQGCQQPLSAEQVHRVLESHRVTQCEHCGRLLIAAQLAPDYIP